MTNKQFSVCRSSSVSGYASTRIFSLVVDKSKVVEGILVYNAQMHFQQPDVRFKMYKQYEILQSGIFFFHWFTWFIYIEIRLKQAAPFLMISRNDLEISQWLLNS